MGPIRLFQKVQVIPLHPAGADPVRPEAGDYRNKGRGHRKPLRAEEKTRYYRERDEEARSAYAKMITSVPARAHVYVDETGVDECLHRVNCRAERGVKVYGGISGRKYRRTNIVAAHCRSKIIAPLPEMRTIIMDNASFHRKKVLHELAQRAKSKVVFLPAYSPGLNPIEKTWANLKAFLRNYAFGFDNIQYAISDYFKVK
jgi:hypothetical protein